MSQFKTPLLLILLLTFSASVVYSQPAKSVGSDSASKPGRGSQLPKKPVSDASLSEEFSFWIKDFKVEHQSLSNNVNISVSFRYVPNIKNSEYPDFRWLTKDVETFLTSYPNEEDYWEIVNKQLTKQLMDKYPVLRSITIELNLDPSSPSPYVRSSRVTRERNK